MTTDVFVMSPETLRALLKKERFIGIIEGMSSVFILSEIMIHKDEIKEKATEIIDKIKKHKSKKEAMDDISEELTDLTMNGASDEELEEAVKRSKDVIDSYK
jgi:hypothetical protein